MARGRSFTGARSDVSKRRRRRDTSTAPSGLSSSGAGLGTTRAHRSELRRREVAPFTGAKARRRESCKPAAGEPHHSVARMLCEAAHLAILSFVQRDGQPGLVSTHPGASHVCRLRPAPVNLDALAKTLELSVAHRALHLQQV